MLTIIEKILFLLLAIASGIAIYITFGQMIRTILRGHDKIQIGNLWKFIKDSLVSFLTQGGIIHRRRITSIFHYGVAWGFVFYGLVNLVDILEGYIPNFNFLGDSSLGNIFRLGADLFTVAGLIGVIYFLIRRFVARDPRLRVRDKVTIYPKALKGIPKDSLIVGLFILFHLGFRFLGQSFLVALEGGDAWQPFANQVANLWSGMSSESLEIAWHVCWWGALGIILVFLPYFPYTKHAHLFMGPINIGIRPKRKSLSPITPLNFEDETIEQFGVARLTDLSQTQILDAFACIMCNR